MMLTVELSREDAIEILEAGGNTDPLVFTLPNGQEARVARADVIRAAAGARKGGDVAADVRQGLPNARTAASDEKDKRGLFVLLALVAVVLLHGKR